MVCLIYLTSIQQSDSVSAGALEQLGNKPAKPCFVSINRFERKKNLGLAIEALHQLCDWSQTEASVEAVGLCVTMTPELRRTIANTKLVVAGISYEVQSLRNLLFG